MGTGGFSSRCVLLAFMLGALIGILMGSLGGKMRSQIESEPLQRRTKVLAEIARDYQSESTSKLSGLQPEFNNRSSTLPRPAVAEGTARYPSSQASTSMTQWQVAGEAELGSDITFSDTFLDGKASAIQWPPSACQSREGALQVLCTDSASSRRLWVLGLELIGEIGLVEFLMRLNVSTPKLGVHRIKMWSDTKFAMNHVMHDQQKDRYNFRKFCPGADSDSWFIDFGGNIGYAAVHMWLRSSVAKIVTVEPSPWNYFLLRLNVAQNCNDGRIIALKAGISNTPGWLSGEYQSHRTALNSARESTGLFETFKTRTIRFQSLIHVFGIKRIHVFKLDCEGCEFDALEWNASGIWDMVRICVGEYHITCQAEDHHGKPKCDTWNKIRTMSGQSIPVEKSKAIWNLLCNSPKIRMLGDSMCHPIGCQCPVHFEWT